VELLRMAYQAHSLSVDVPLASSTEEELVVKTYLLYFLLPWSQTAHPNTSSIQEFLPEATDSYPGWDDTLVWVNDLKEGIKYEDRGEHNPFTKKEEYFRDFPSMVHLVEQIIDRIGTFQNLECRMMKSLLMDLNQDRNDGRVPLGKFWGPSWDDEHHYFTESPEYLKHLGALDESNPQELSVIVPNIITGRSNCLAASDGFHSLCCIDQCVGLMEALERDIAHPVATPSRIAELVAALPSDTVVAPRNLSGSLRRKLDNIATQHEGQVPLHGRMFAQWMHHAFPNECPLPLALGAEAPMTHEEWIENRDTDSTASEEMMRQTVTHARSAAPTTGPLAHDELAILWSEEEELVSALDIERLVGQQGRGGALWDILRFAAMAVATLATLTVFWDYLRSSVSFFQPQVCKSSAPGLPRWLGEGQKATGTKSQSI